MKKEFVSYELAVKLKELGFDEPCFGIYLMKEFRYSSPPMTLENTTEGIELLAPTFSQAFRWFREKYGLEGIAQQAEDFKWFKWKISQYNEDGKKYVADWFEYQTYEEAELACLEKLIEIIENK